MNRVAGNLLNMCLSDSLIRSIRTSISLSASSSSLFSSSFKIFRPLYTSDFYNAVSPTADELSLLLSMCNVTSSWLSRRLSILCERFIPFIVSAEAERPSQ